MKVRCVIIDVRQNDPVDIRCGGPSHLGFDFFVNPKENPKKLEKFLLNALKQNGIDSILSLTISRPVLDGDVKKIWTHRRMAMCIKKEASGMLA